MEKRLGALILEGVPVISLDNCSEDIGGDLLCQITERRLIRIRILGKSEAPECEWRGVLFGTGNNVALLGDLARRGLISHLDPKVERPELREFNFDPIERVLTNRGAYIAAAITIARAYNAAGSPKVCGALGSYGEWAKVVRAPLIWLGQADPVESMEKTREEDPVRGAARNLIGFWKEELVLGVGYSAIELINHVKLKDVLFGVEELKHPEFRDLLMQQAGTSKGEIDARSLGNWLMSARGQIHYGHRIEVTRKAARGNRYALVKV